MSIIRSPAGSGLPDLPRPDGSFRHLHVDSYYISDAFRERLRGLGFEPDFFLSHDRIADIHSRGGTVSRFDLKTLTKTRPPTELWSAVLRGSQPADEHRCFQERCRRLLEEPVDPADFGGYVEREEGVLWKLPFMGIPYKTGQGILPLLHTGHPETPKKADFHISLAVEGTDPRLVRDLADHGMNVIVTPRDQSLREAKAIVLTAQGTRDQIRLILPAVWQYLLASGGYGEGSKVIHEKITGWRETAGSPMPPVIRKIQ